MVGTGEKIEAHEVPSDEQERVLVHHFGARDMLRVDDAVHIFMRMLADNYVGSVQPDDAVPWRFFELSNGGLYMAPPPDAFYDDEAGRGFHIRVNTNGCETWMSADAAGLTACLFAFSYLSFRIRGNSSLARHYHLLYGFMGQHAERDAIYTAVR